MLGYPGAHADITLHLIKTILLSMALSVPISHLGLHFDFPFSLLESVVTQPWTASGLSQSLLLMKNRGLQHVELAIKRSFDGVKQTISESDRETIKGLFSRNLHSTEYILNILFM